VFAIADIKLRPVAFVIEGSHGTRVTTNEVSWGGPVLRAWNDWILLERPPSMQERPWAIVISVEIFDKAARRCRSLLDLAPHI